MLHRLTTALAVAALLAACVPRPQTVRENPNTPKVVVTTALLPDDAYRTLNANLVRCFAGPNFLIAGAPSSPTRPPQILINTTLGHLFTVIDFAPKGAQTEVTVNVSFAVARKKRTAWWQQSMDAWLRGGDPDFCPPGP